MTKPTFYITTAIVYPNGAPHVGYAYEVVAADAVARWKRLDGFDVRFQIGSDEHGQKIAAAARKEGISPKAYVDRMVEPFQEFRSLLDSTHDRFIRTTDPDHLASAEELWRRMERAGDIYLGRYDGWYSVRDEAFYDEGETTVTSTGARLGPQGTPVAWVEEESYFFRLSAYQDRLSALYDTHPGFISPPSRRNEIVSFVRGGLSDLSISRTSFDWGIPVPGAPGHVMYVWVDALQNYLTGTGFPDASDPLARYWPADLHVIGKDIVRFHAVYWPAFLLSAGLPLPQRVFGHGWLLNRGEKMSKSLGNVVDPRTLVELYGPDAFRYFVLREIPFGEDGNYGHEAIRRRINADLANDLGNLAQRCLTMVAKNLDGLAPGLPFAREARDEALLARAWALPGALRPLFDVLELHRAAEEIWGVVADANRYFAGEAPWAVRRTDAARFAAILGVTMEALRAIGIVVAPFLPRASPKLLDLLGAPADARDLAAVGEGGAVAAGTPLPAPEALFPRVLAPEGEAA